MSTMCSSSSVVSDGLLFFNRCSLFDVCVNW